MFGSVLFNTLGQLAGSTGPRSAWSVGDPYTIAQLYADHGKMVFNMALNHLQDKEEAEEVTQDVFVKVYAKLAAGSPFACSAPCAVAQI